MSKGSKVSMQERQAARLTVQAALADVTNADITATMQAATAMSPAELGVTVGSLPRVPGTLTPATKDACLKFLRTYLERRGQPTELVVVAPKSKAKPKPEKKAKPTAEDHARTYNELAEFLTDTDPASLTAPELQDACAGLAELLASLPPGKPADKATAPTRRNAMKQAGLPVTGTVPQLAERLAVYYGFAPAKAKPKGAVAWERLAEFTDDDLSAELERRRVSQSPTSQLLAGGIC